MHPTYGTLEVVLILLATAVLMVALFRRLKLPSLLAYLVMGITIGPQALGWVPNTYNTRHLAEFGIVFLMFSIGLEFSLSQMKSMRSMVFGFGGAQVLLTLALTGGIALFLGLSLTTAFVLGSIFSMSSTAIVSKMLVERGELHSRHGQLIIGALLFQDLAVIPFITIIPALASESANLPVVLSIALLKAIFLLIIFLFFGQKLTRPLFDWVARYKSSELFMLNILLVTLGTAFLTQQVGLSPALGAFLAGMLISETQYRYQVEADIKPFRDILLGLFFVTVGMMLDLKVIFENFVDIALVWLGLLLVKILIIVPLARAYGNQWSGATRTGLALAQAGEFGFVLLTLASASKLLEPDTMQIILAAMLLSMLTAPFFIQFSEQIIRFFLRTEWNDRAKEVHEIAVRSFGKQDHVILCGYGRTGQNLARILEHEEIAFIALDMDLDRVRLAASAGDSVVYGDAGRREVLLAAGLKRAGAIVITYADTASSMKVLHCVKEIRDGLPVIVRTKDDGPLQELRNAGATEVVPELVEATLMLAQQILMIMQVPLDRIISHIQGIREQRYTLLAGFFHGLSDVDAETTSQHPRLHSVPLGNEAKSIGKMLKELELDKMGIQVTAIRRRNIRGVSPTPETELQAGDILVLLGTAQELALAEKKLLYS